jgi:hypothetical protein
MPRYAVQRRFPRGSLISVDDGGVNVCHTVTNRDAGDGVARARSY